MPQSLPCVRQVRTNGLASIMCKKEKELEVHSSVKKSGKITFFSTYIIVHRSNKAVWVSFRNTKRAHNGHDQPKGKDSQQEKDVGSASLLILLQGRWIPRVLMGLTHTANHLRSQTSGHTWRMSRFKLACPLEPGEGQEEGGGLCFANTCCQFT